MTPPDAIRFRHAGPSPGPCIVCVPDRVVGGRLYGAVGLEVSGAMIGRPREYIDLTEVGHRLAEFVDRRPQRLLTRDPGPAAVMAELYDPIKPAFDPATLFEGRTRPYPTNAEYLEHCRILNTFHLDEVFSESLIDHDEALLYETGRHQTLVVRSTPDWAVRSFILEAGSFEAVGTRAAAWILSRTAAG